MSSELSPILSLIRRHLHRYPESTFRDVYKLLHQAAFGPGHVVKNKKKALEWIERDLEDPGIDIPLLESIHPDNAMLRLHLHPYAARGGNLKRLRDAFVASARDVPGSADMMTAWWAALCAWVEAEGILDTADFDPREMRLFGRMHAARGWPAVHHSVAYRTAYRPAYRVLTARQAEALCRKQDIPFVSV